MTSSSIFVIIKQERSGDYIMNGNINCVGYYEYFRTKIDDEPYYIVNVYNPNKRLIDNNVYDNYTYMKDCIGALNEVGFIPILNIKE